MSNVVNINPPTVIENILDALNEKVKKDDELYVMHCRTDPDTGERYLNWYTSACSSRLMAIGALTYLTHKLMEGNDNYDEDFDEDDTG